MAIGDACQYTEIILLRCIDHAPEKGEEFAAIARDFQEQIMPGITHWQHPSFFAFFPSITNFESILADMYATSVSNPGFNVSTGLAFSLRLW